MKLEHESEKKLKKEILQIAGKHLDLNKYKIFFFGSRVSGEENERSDIDIGIEGTTRLSAKIFSSIKEDVENLPMLYSIDVVDFKRVSPEFRRVAMKNIEPLLL